MLKSSSMEMLQVISQSSNSAELSWNTSETGHYNVTCTSSIDDSSSSLRNHLVTVLGVTFQNVSQFTVQPLALSTNYTCCLERDQRMICSDNFVTSGPSAIGGLSLEVAGVIGGVVGAVVTLLLIAGITSIAIGTAILLRRKR